MSFYDTPIDVVRKAARGLEIALPGSDEQVGAWLATSGERIPGEVAGRLAPLLGLDPVALATFPSTPGELPLPGGVRRLELPFDDETVNAWLVDTADGGLVIDAGSGRDDLLRALEQLEVGRVDLLVTHPHRDHVGGLEAVRSRLRSLHAPVGSGIAGAIEVAPDSTIRIGDLAVAAIDLCGHHPHSLGWSFSAGDGTRVVAVGDALFAGSMGGCAGRAAYLRAHERVRRHLLGLPAGTVLLTGHGPATTVGLELRRNPFVANGAGPPGLSAADASP